jgi:hypothetical protein
MINNILVLSPPKELRESDEDKKRMRESAKGALDVDFLAENKLVNILEAEEKEVYKDRLSRNLLDNDFLANVLDIINAQLAAQLDLLGKTNPKTPKPRLCCIKCDIKKIIRNKLNICFSSTQGIYSPKTTHYSSAHL